MKIVLHLIYADAKLLDISNHYPASIKLSNLPAELSMEQEICFQKFFLTALRETIISKKTIAKDNLKKNVGKVQLHTVQIDNQLKELIKIFACPLSF